MRVAINEEIPCDMVMLASEDPEGGCYITTANLDGETNLKVCQVHDSICQLSRVSFHFRIFSAFPIQSSSKLKIPLSLYVP